MRRLAALALLLSASLSCLASDDIETLAARAGALLKSGDYKGAARDADQALKLDPDNVDLLLARILALTGARELDTGLQACNDALTLAPTDPRIWTARSNLRNLRKEFDLARSDAEQALSLDPGNAEARLAMALAQDGLSAPKEEPARGRPWLQEHRVGASVALAVLLAFLAASPLLLFRRLLSPAQPVPEEAEAQAPVYPKVGGYRVIKALASGGMGIVYEGVDKALDRRVAIKKMRDEIRNDPTERERFLSEARMVASLHHPNIVEIYEILEDGFDAYLVFEYVDGKTLHELLAVRKRLPLREAACVMQGTAAALDYAHARGMVHRDLKPSNIMVTRELKVKVMDFGVARQGERDQDGLAMTNTVVGTPSYMAPEQFEGKVCRGSDVYALGICMYEMVTGELPFSGEGGCVQLAKLNKTYVPPSRLMDGLPTGFDDVLDKVLEPDSEKRWKSAAEFAAALKRLA